MAALPYIAADQGGGVFAQARILSGIQRGQGDTAYNIERNRLGGQQEHETTAAQEWYTKPLRTIIDISAELESRLSKLQAAWAQQTPNNRKVIMDQNEFQQDMQAARAMHDAIVHQVTEVKDIISGSSDSSEVEKARDVLARIREIMTEFRETLLYCLSNLDQLSAKARDVGERAPLESQKAGMNEALSQFGEAEALIEKTLAITRQ
jgi:hypothetical protein